MGFYIRKAFSSGPIRLNLSKSGLGLSVGVPGFRVGAGPKGVYTHAGRYGLYYRKYMGKGGGRAAAPAGGKVERLVVAEGYEGEQIHQAEPGAFREFPPVSRAWLVLFPVYLVLAFMAWIDKSRAVEYAGEVEAAMIKAAAEGRDPGPEVEALKSRYKIPEYARAWAHEVVLQHVLAGVLADWEVTEEEAKVLAAVDSMLGIPPERGKELKADWYRAAYMDAVADRELDEDEQMRLEAVRRGLGLPDRVIADELETVERLARIRKIREGELTPVECSCPLKNETCFFQGRGKKLGLSTVASYQRQGVKYKDKGLLAKKEGVLLITDKRIMIVGDGTYSIPVNRVLDIEVDLDSNILIITRDDRKKPVYLSTPETMVAGAVVERLLNA